MLVLALGALVMVLLAGLGGTDGDDSSGNDAPGDLPVERLPLGI